MPGLKLTYNSPNHSHHYPYAELFRELGCLHCFVSGYPRGGGRPVPKTLRPFIRHADELQYVYLALLRCGSPGSWQRQAAYLSKCLIDRRSRRPALESDVFLFYSGAGLDTMRHLRRQGASTRCIVEAVNTHAQTQRDIVAEEYQRAGLPAPRYAEREFQRRLAEYREADGILCPSQAVKESFIEHGIAAERVWVVNYGFTPPTLASDQRKGQSHEDFTILYAGQIHVRKGLRYLLEAFAQLRHPRKHLILAGPMTHEPGIRLDRLPSGAVYLGALKADQLNEAYRAADVLVQPSVEEGLSLVVAEALSHGCPVIATHATGAGEILHDGDGGWLIPARDPDALRQRLQQLADAPSLRQQAHEQALKSASQLGGWERTREQMKAFLHELPRIPARKLSASA